MKNVIATFVIGISILILSRGSYACGSVEGWVDIYFDNTHSKQKDALQMIHCEPVVVVFGQSNATLTQHKLLSKMIAAALEEPNPCNQALAIKNFFIFDFFVARY